MDNRESAADVVFEYTGDGCSVPKDITSVRFNDGLQRISSCAFKGCSNLREVTLNDGLKKIGEQAFCNCTSLDNIAFPSTVTDIDHGAFSSCHNLREVTFNDGLQKIGTSAFFSCTSLESIKLPSTVTEIGEWAFRGCRNLRVIILNDGLQNIGTATFYNCSSLESVTLPSTLINIGSSAFSGCSNLRVVELNDGLQKIGRWVFHNCDALERCSFPTLSYRLENIIQTSHWEELEDKVNEVRGVVQWESEKLFVSRATLHNWDDIRRDLGKITQLVSYYELKEATTTFELALWKFNLDQADENNITNRDAYRIDVPGPVKDTMLQYLILARL